MIFFGIILILTNSFQFWNFTGKKICSRNICETAFTRKKTVFSWNCTNKTSGMSVKNINLCSKKSTEKLVPNFSCHSAMSGKML